MSSLGERDPSDGRRGSELQAILPLFIVSDLPRAVAFYRDVLGFELRLSLPDSDPFFALVRRDGVGILLKHVAPEVAPLPNPGRHPWAKWDAFVSTPDPDVLAAECRERSPGLDCEVRDTEDGLRGFELADADGYVLFFGRPREA